MPDDLPKFIGDHEDIPVDPKGRLIFPVAFRKALPGKVDSLIVAQWFDGCLAVFDPNGWNLVVEQLRGLESAPGARRQTRQLMRALAGRATEIKLDRQGRMLIPRKHLEMAGIADRATLVGVIDRVEIWNPGRYLESQSEVDLEAAAEELEWF